MAVSRAFWRSVRLGPRDLSWMAPGSILRAIGRFSSVAVSGLVRDYE